MFCIMDQKVKDLYREASKGRIENVNNLVASGVSVNKSNALSAAASSGHVNVVMALVKAGANVDQVFAWSTPLYKASLRGHLEVVKALVNAGANVNKADESGATPLYIAANQGHTNVVRALVGAGATIDQEVISGAESSGHENVVRMLKEILKNRASANVGLKRIKLPVDILPDIKKFLGGNKTQTMKYKPKQPKQKQKRTKSKRSVGKKHKIYKVTRKQSI